MQRMRPNIPPEPIKPNLGRGSPRARSLEHPRRHPQPRVRSHNFDARDPLRNFSASFGGDLGPALRVDVILILSVELEGGPVGEGCGGAEVGEEVAVC